MEDSGQIYKRKISSKLQDENGKYNVTRLNLSRYIETESKYGRNYPDKPNYTTIEEIKITTIHYDSITESIIKNFHLNGITIENSKRQIIRSTVENLVNTLNEDSFFINLKGSYYGDEVKSITLEGNLICNKINDLINSHVVDKNFKIKPQNQTFSYILNENKKLKKEIEKLEKEVKRLEDLLETSDLNDVGDDW